ncbi:hypothetical protein Avbf_18739 [Armadillidium vulgare]|nr:hypothetical protein Avbf_18739 [Armadillidium vulgare]
MKYLVLLLVLINLKLIFGQKNSNRNFFSNKDGRFIKAQQVTTFTDYIFSTKTIYPQCVASVVTGSPCMGKRRRRKKRMTVDTDNEALKQRNDDVTIDGSIGNNESKGETGKAGSKREPKFGFTIWTTTRTTATATVKYTNTSTTLSLNIPLYCRKCRVPISVLLVSLSR